MAEAFVSLVREERGVVLAEVVTAVPLDEARRAEINALIGKVHEGGVELSERVDPHLIGGFKLRVGDRMIDASVFQSLGRCTQPHQQPLRTGLLSVPHTSCPRSNPPSIRHPA